jgi:hypothetical protein
MKSTHGNINPSSNSSSTGKKAILIRYFILDFTFLERKINNVVDFFKNNSLINENFQDEKKERLSLLKSKKNSKNYGHIPAFVIDPCSSDEESDIEEEKINEASIRDVSNIMIDLNTIMTVRNFEEFPKEARPALLFQNLEEWITPANVKQFIEDCPCFL